MKIVNIPKNTILYHGSSREPSLIGPTFFTPIVTMAMKYGDNLHTYVTTDSINNIIKSSNPDDIVEFLGGDPENQTPGECLELMEDMYRTDNDPINGFWITRNEKDEEICLVDTSKLKKM